MKTKASVHDEIVNDKIYEGSHINEQDSDRLVDLWLIANSFPNLLIRELQEPDQETSV